MVTNLLFVFVCGSYKVFFSGRGGGGSVVLFCVEPLNRFVEMTISYQKTLGSAGGGFACLLFKWKGSLYKLCYRELAMFLVPFAILSAIYRHVLNENQKKYCNILLHYFSLSLSFN